VSFSGGTSVGPVELKRLLAVLRLDELERASGETVKFGSDGRAWEIDLSDDNAAALCEALQP